MREYLLTLCITAAVTYLLTGPVRKFAIVAGAMPEIRARDVHREPTPRLGGIAMFFGLCAGLLVADHLPNLNEVFTKSNEPRALLSGAALIWLIGVLDDKFEIDALIKLGGQMIAAGVMVLFMVASMAIGVVRQYPTYSNGWANIRAFAGGCSARSPAYRWSAASSCCAALPSSAGAWA